MFGFTSVPVILDAPLPVVPPVMLPVTDGAGQVYVVPVGTIPLVTSIGVDVKPVPPQVVEVIAVIAGFGFTVTVSVKVDPVQLPEVGVTV